MRSEMFTTDPTKSNATSGVSDAERPKLAAARPRIFVLAVTLAGLIGGTLVLVAGLVLWAIHGLYSSDVVLDQWSSILAGVGLLLIIVGAMFVDKVNGP